MSSKLVPASGKPKPPRAGMGRPKGSKNKTTAAIKDMILQALANKGGVDYLEQQAEENPTAFMTLVGKVIPLQVNGAGEDGEHLHSLTVKFVRPGS